MPFIPQLPTWNCTITPYKYNATTGLTIQGDDFDGQYRQMLEAAEVVGEETCFLRYPKEVDFLVDASQLPTTQWQAVKFTWQGEDWYWQVTQTMPRWPFFPNEHRLALLTRLRPVDLADLLNGLEIPDPDQSSVYWEEDEVLADGVAVGHFHIVLRNGAGDPIAGHIVWPSEINSTNVFFSPADCTTDSNGECVFTATNEIEETVSAKGYDSTTGVTTTDSDSIIFDSGIEWTIAVSGASDDTCNDCAALNSTFEAMVDGENFWWTQPFTFNCSTTTEAYWAMTRSGDTMGVYLFEFDNFTQLAQYSGDLTGWNEVDPVTCNLDSDDGQCNYPATIEIAPD